VVATTTVLVAVFLPVGFMEGNTGRLFRELSVALAGAVALSAFVALTLTPMMSSRLLRPHSEEKGTRVHRWVNGGLAWLADRYRRVLAVGLDTAGLVGLLWVAAAGLSVLLFRVVPSELAPAEDRGAFFVSIVGPEGAGFDYTGGQVQQAEQVFSKRVGEGGAIRRYNTR